MTRHISDSERLTLAALNRKETELKQERERSATYLRELKAMKSYVWELKDSNKILAAQVNYLITKQKQNATD